MVAGPATAVVDAIASAMAAMSLFMLKSLYWRRNQDLIIDRQYRVGPRQNVSLYKSSGIKRLTDNARDRVRSIMIFDPLLQYQAGACAKQVLYMARVF